MFLRGRDHFFVLRPNPLRGADGAPIGLILTLQDVTYLRDQEARREQLMATLSHELRTPLTSLRMASSCWPVRRRLQLETPHRSSRPHATTSCASRTSRSVCSSSRAPGQ
jgi:signal transduction histidine kinase